MGYSEISISRKLLTVNIFVKTKKSKIISPSLYHKWLEIKEIKNFKLINSRKEMFNIRT